MSTIRAILRTPADANGNREKVDLITSADAVVFENGNSLNDELAALTESMVNGGIIFSTADNKPVAPALWGEIWSDSHDR